MKAIYKTSQVQLNGDGRSVVVIGTIEEGSIMPGLSLLIPLGGSLNLTVPITEVRSDAGGRVVLRLDCEDVEGAQMVEALNFADEILAVE